LLVGDTHINFFLGNLHNNEKVINYTHGDLWMQNKIIKKKDFCVPKIKKKICWQAKCCTFLLHLPGLSQTIFISTLLLICAAFYAVLSLLAKKIKNQ